MAIRGTSYVEWESKNEKKELCYQLKIAYGTALAAFILKKSSTSIKAELLLYISVLETFKGSDPDGQTFLKWAAAWLALYSEQNNYMSHERRVYSWPTL